MQKTQFVPMEKDALLKEISNIGKAGAKLNLRIQIAALNAIHYSIAHGYIEYGQKLVLAMNAGQRKNSLVAFLEKWGKFEWNKEQKNLVFRKRDDLTLGSVETIGEFWYDTIKAPEPKSMYDFEEDVQKFIKKMEKAINDQSTIVHSELRDYMVQAYQQWQQDQIVEEESSEQEFGDAEFTELQDLIHAQTEIEEIESSDNSRQAIRMAA